MEWGKAKNVLIFAFLVLNIVLGYQLWANIQDGPSLNGDAYDLSAETRAIMREKNIRLDSNTNIPSETPKLRELTFRVTEKLGENTRHTLEHPVDSKIVFNEGELNRELGGIIPDLKEYSYDRMEDGAFILTRMADGRPMFEVRLALYFSNQKIVAYSQDRVELVESDNPEEKEQTVLPATKALESLIFGHFKPGTVIRDIKLGYHGQDFNSETQFSAPSWRVLLEDGKVYYVHAISAEVFTEKEEKGSSS
ncbi:two-component system regulatory protein YycI [Paenibacillus sp. GCM10027626]|uniref:two-component system regulatory protein YycI n=1 Tax=Paenibacillus sp. GCM10027626 TaxID=3273411 RepID=UPI00362D113A